MTATEVVLFIIDAIFGIMLAVAFLLGVMWARHRNGDE